MALKSCDTKNFLKTFLTKIKAQEKRKKIRGKRKVKSGDCCVKILLFVHPQTWEAEILLLEKIRRPRSAQPINGILGSFGSVWPDSDWISF